MMQRRVRALVAVLMAVGGAVACRPKVQVEAPTEPITINLNVKIEHEIRVKVDKDLDDLFEKREDIF